MYDKFLLLYNMNSKQGRTILYIQLLNAINVSTSLQTTKPMIMTIATFGSDAPPRGILIQESLIGGWFSNGSVEYENIFANGVFVASNFATHTFETVFSHGFHDSKFH